ncbi:PDZ domain-containing protein [candidate division KSB1 bacterium]|nr:PDZ domain-containing protein [bacterium]NUM66720.1 PDZ domain-containing protein [candidate division KSB1 bacterium]
MRLVFCERLAAVSMLVLAFSGAAQEKTAVRDTTGGRSFTFTSVAAGPGGIFNLPELGAVIIGGEKEIKFEAVMPSEHRPKAYKDIDLQSGDLILMMNAKRVKSAKEIEEIYSGLKVGEEVKLGIKRKEERFIVTFSKADPKDLPQRMMMVMNTDNAGGQAGPNRRIVMGGREFSGDVAPLPGLGIIAGSKEGGEVRVLDLMPNASQAVGSADIKKDDVILALNGEKIKSAVQLGELYEKIAVGAKLELHYRRGDKAMTASLVKPDAPAGTTIRREIRQ